MVPHGLSEKQYKDMLLGTFVLGIGEVLPVADMKDCDDPPATEAAHPSAGVPAIEDAHPSAGEGGHADIDIDQLVDAAEEAADESEWLELLEEALAQVGSFRSQSVRVPTTHQVFLLPTTCLRFLLPTSLLCLV